MRLGWARRAEAKEEAWVSPSPAAHWVKEGTPGSLGDRSCQLCHFLLLFWLIALS